MRPIGQKPLKSRLIVVGSVTYQSGLGESHPVNIRFSRQLDNEEDRPNVNHGKASKEWEELKTEGFVMLTIENTEGKQRRTIPDAGERLLLEASVIVLGVKVGDTVVGFAQVRPGEVVPLLPVQDVSYCMRSITEPTRYTLTTFPK